MVVAPGERLHGGRYELVRELGSGGVASVWLGRDLRLERPVAIKILAAALADDDEYLARFRREARVAASLMHPNLVSVFDFDADAEQPFLVMQFVEGGDLGERLASGKPVDAERVARDLLRALEHIHRAGVVHRDVKPRNVLLGRQGEMHLSDFGIARPQDAASITRTGQMPGTARYMAPELWRGEPAGERSDLFSAGVVVRECLAPDSPAHLVELVEALAAREPEDRPASATAALARLDRVAEHAGVEAEPDRQPLPPLAAGEPARVRDDAPPEPAPRRGRTPPGLPQPRAREVHVNGRRLLAGAGLAALAALAVVAVLSLGGGDDAPGPKQRAQRDQPPPQEQQAPAEGGGENATAPTVPQPRGDDPVQAAALNNEGHDLILAGAYSDAVPVLRRAVETFPPGVEASARSAPLDETELNYGYTLYNLGNALRLAGRPQQAVPVLRRRLTIPDQTGTVRQELDAAIEAARN